MAGSCCGFVREAKRGAGLKRDEFARGVWQGTGPFARVTRGALMPASWMFTAASSARTALYRLGMLQPQRLATPIVSIGNLRVGGSGKTPLVIWLVEKLRAAGGNVAVVSRGYGRGHDALTVFTADSTSPETLTAVAPCCSGYEHVHVRADGRTELRTPRAEAADEAVLVAARTGVPVVVATDRVLACRAAESLFRPDLIVVDDGFQHLRLARDIDVVLVSEDDLHARTLPAGPLRERATALERADYIIRTDGDGEGPVMLRRPDALFGPEGERIGDARDLSGKSVVAVAGVAAPERFESMLDDLGANRLATLRFDDHHRYDRADRESIASAAAEADFIVTTEKDMVTLRPLFRADPRLVALRLQAELNGADSLLERIARLDARNSGLHHRGFGAAAWPFFGSAIGPQSRVSGMKKSRKKGEARHGGTARGGAA